MAWGVLVRLVLGIMLAFIGLCDQQTARELDGILATDHPTPHTTTTTTTTSTSSTNGSAVVFAWGRARWVGAGLHDEIASA